MGFLEHLRPGIVPESRFEYYRKAISVQYFSPAGAFPGQISQFMGILWSEVCILNLAPNGGLSLCASVVTPVLSAPYGEDSYT